MWYLVICEVDDSQIFQRDESFMGNAIQLVLSHVKADQISRTRWKEKGGQDHSVEPILFLPTTLTLNFDDGYDGINAKDIVQQTAIVNDASTANGHHTKYF